ncbi:pseudouridylate synthase 7 homolog [Paramacrobiotus metropolitanus]|uniref:pseudouridylate synthase 7 homolog n=1 Tax=Paramacrobiotus metropolitanus TaxID=2943436 RepID=UPI0024459D2A|nr:pseudouridylate synthase 7 homolog [Paramacrobiotus metropolitanus]
MVDKETLFGISEYFASGIGFDGTLKSRISDFLVNEIDTDGNVVHLTRLGVDTPAASEVAPACGRLDPQLVAKIEAFLHSNDANLLIEASEDKNARRLLHQQIDAAFPTHKLLRTPLRDASTGVHQIEISRASSRTPAFRRQEATRMNRSADGASHFLHFILYKENTDTMEAVHRIGQYLRLPPKCLQYAGVKDKRAKTVQKVSVRFRDPQRLAGFNQTGVLIGNIAYAQKQLQLGDLTGNRFRLVIREVSLTDRTRVEEAARSFAEQGFVNYFGLQRFGTTEVATFEVGQALLRAEWAEAVQLILKPRENDNVVTAKCRAVWVETGDAEAALRVLGRKSCVEGFVLKELARKKDDWLAALQAVPRNMRMMYVHSYQSYLWNLTASYRIRELGRKPVVGDLVYKTASHGDAKRLKRGADAEAEVTILTEAELEAYSIYDVLLPLPGYDVQFPQTPVTEFLLDITRKDGIDLRSRHKIKDYSLSGSYRPLVTKPRDVRWEIKFFDDPDQMLLLSDGDVLNGVSLPPSSAESGSYMALIMEFNLLASVYATMAIRELMKRSSNVLSKFSASEPAEEPEGNALPSDCFVQDVGDSLDEAASAPST